MRGVAVFYMLSGSSRGSSCQKLRAMDTKLIHSEKAPALHRNLGIYDDDNSFLGTLVSSESAESVELLAPSLSSSNLLWSTVSARADHRSLSMEPLAASES